MSQDESALLVAIAADPASDLPRLVYADWLDDHGQGVRAEFIRLQCEIARLEVGPRAVVDANWRLWKRQQDLLDDHLPELLGPATFLADCRPVFRRGFVVEVELTADRFLSIDADLAALSLRPAVSVVRLDGYNPVGFLRSRHLAVVTELELTQGNHPEADLAENPLVLLADASGRLTGLEALDLSSWQVNDGEADLLATADFPALRSLDLSVGYLTDRGLIALLAAPFARRLVRLVLDANPVGDQAAFELADRLGPVKTLRTLDFRRTRVTAAGQLALTSAFGSRCNLF